MKGPAAAHWGTLPYEPPIGGWDEAVLPSGFPRRHWRRLAAGVARLGLEQLQHGWEVGQQLIAADGAGSDEQQAADLTLVDPIPLMLRQDEWTRIEASVVQRATLLNDLLADVYGPRRMLAEGLLPAPLLYANPHFLRPSDGLALGDHPWLQSYAVDLARAADGGWRVVADHTQALAGAGYTLANRQVSARALSGVFAQHYVRSVAPFFDHKRDALLRMTHSRGEKPLVVLLVSGWDFENQFEYSFLAGLWGFPMVTGPDLTVRDSRVYLKTLAGLEPVHAIVRGIDDSVCDPLELRGDSLLGVPGLLQAVRSGTVIIDNALGAGLAESPALASFLPAICRRLYGNDLMLPGVASWWCGDDRQRAYVLDHLDELAVKGAFPQAQSRARGPRRAARQAQSESILLHPERYAACERVGLSTVPVFLESAFVPRHALLRVFAAWDGVAYRVLPGGLTGVSSNAEILLGSRQFGACKDTWALGQDADQEPGPAQVAIETHQARVSLPSGAAENCFWLGRYTERLETRARLVRVMLPALAAEEDFGRGASLTSTLHLLVRLGYLPADILSAFIGEQLYRVRRVLTEMICDPSGTAGIGWDLKQIRRLARQLKERLSADTWRVLQQMEGNIPHSLPSDPHQHSAALGRVLDATILTASAFSGLVMENTTRGDGWRFLEIGRRLERVLQLTEMLQCCIVDAPTEIEPFLQMLLQLADSAITYRTRYFSFLRTDRVLDLLLLDESNPRSVRFQLAALLDHARNLPRLAEAGEAGLEQRVVEKALAAVGRADVTVLAQHDEEGMRPLAELIQHLTADMHDLSDMLMAHYVSHVTPPLISLF